MNADYRISELIEYAISKGLIEKEDTEYCTNQILSILKLNDFCKREVDKVSPLCEILSELCDIAYENGIIESNTVAYRDLLDTAIMGVFVARPSEVSKKFYELYSKSPRLATDYFYSLACDSNYIRLDRIKRDLKWQYPSEYGPIDITVNLSKPEKDPKAIAAAKSMPQSSYPKCALCHENVGFAGSIAKAPRQNLRQIPFDMAGKDWYIQYSPYVYYNEHCIALSSEHTPMKIDCDTFKKLLCFVDTFPHYFIGSNADLPIVGGSILSHDHMQGGRYTFAMENAKCKQSVSFFGFSDVSAYILKWPMSVIRLVSESKESLTKLASKILNAWRTYTDKDSYIFAKTNAEMHNTITPIARKKQGKFELDLVLRNNITTDDHPLGLYHPHKEYHNIKKENIGLIEVMGLAVLPARLKDEIEAMKHNILKGRDFALDPLTEKHRAWYLSFKDRYSFNEDNVDKIIEDEIGATFVNVLKDAGVYKDTDAGLCGFLKFIDFVNAQ